MQSTSLEVHVKQSLAIISAMRSRNLAYDNRQRTKYGANSLEFSNAHKQYLIKEADFDTLEQTLNALLDSTEELNEMVKDRYREGFIAGEKRGATTTREEFFGRGSSTNYKQRELARDHSVIKARATWPELY
jgi:hypothetical protein